MTQNLKKDMGYKTLTEILNKENIKIEDAKSTLMPQNVLKTIDNFFNFNAKDLEMYKELYDEICHYNQLSSTLDSQIIDAMNAKIKDLCKDTEKSTYDSKALFDLVTQGKMSFDEFNNQVENKKNNPTIFEHSGYILDSTLSKHYYNPIIIDKNKNGQIIYAIKEESEIEFLQDLKDFIQESNLLDSYEWCFCRLVENVDSIFIPYFDEQSQEYRKFYPDFIFWLKDKQTKSYKIFFIDPKGLQNPYNAKDKLKGFQAIFQTHRAKELNAKDNIEVFLYYYNKEINQDKELEAHIKGSIKGIFKSLES